MQGRREDIRARENTTGGGVASAKEHEAEGSGLRTRREIETRGRRL
jgi:hypothetical protein